MRKIKVQIENLACEICGKEIPPTIEPFDIEAISSEGAVDETYYFHWECVEKLLIETAKEFNKNKKQL